MHYVSNEMGVVSSCRGGPWDAERVWHTRSPTQQMARQYLNPGLLSKIYSYHLTPTAFPQEGTQKTGLEKDFPQALKKWTTLIT